MIDEATRVNAEIQSNENVFSQLSEHLTQQILKAFNYRFETESLIVNTFHNKVYLAAILELSVLSHDIPQQMEFAHFVRRLLKSLNFNF